MIEYRLLIFDSVLVWIGILMIGICVFEVIMFGRCVVLLVLVIIICRLCVVVFLLYV